jgi:hypothetical protein
MKIQKYFSLLKKMNLEFYNHYLGFLCNPIKILREVLPPEIISKFS